MTKISVHQSNLKGVFGFTFPNEEKKLPSKLNNKDVIWEYSKDINIDKSTKLFGADPKKIFDSISNNGFYICKTIIESTEQIDPTMSEINSKDISVVVQGPVEKNLTKKCLTSIRKYLPQAKIILSTWKGTDCSGLDYDELVLNEDPGSFYSLTFPGGALNNINRELVSTQNGLKLATTKYSMKIRTDFALKGTGFLKYFRSFNKFLPDEQMRLFKNRIVTIDFENNLLFRLGDFFSFGETADLKKFLNVPLATSEEQENYQFKNKNSPLIKEICMSARYITEQYILMHCVAKNIPEVFDIYADYTDISEYGKEFSEKILANNFIIVGARSGVFPLKKRLRFCRVINYFYDWQMLYKKHIDPQYKIPLKDLNFQKAFCLEKDISKIKKHYAFFITPFKKTIRWFFAPLRIFFLISKILLKGTVKCIKR